MTNVIDLLPDRGLTFEQLVERRYLFHPEPVFRRYLQVAEVKHDLRGKK